MAKVVNPLHSSEARGKLGGLVYNTCRGIRYTKTNTAPAQPRTAAQMTVRALMTTISREWKALTQTQRDAWKVYADANPLADWTGNPIHMTGANAYGMLNLQARYAGGTQITDVPTTSAPALPAGGAITKPASDLVLNWTGALPTGIKADVWYLGPVSAGVSGRLERAKHKVFSAAAASGPLTVITGVSNGRHIVWWRTVDTASGLQSQFQKLTLDVT